MVLRAFLILCLTLAIQCKSKAPPSPLIPAHLQKAVVLCFHDITEGRPAKGVGGRYSVSQSDFQEILAVLSAFKVVSLRDWVEAKDPGDVRPRVILTFDDGYAAHREIVMPELIRRGMQATFFFYAEALARDKRWRQLASESKFDFGSHSWSHALLKEISYDALFKELYTARNFLESALARKIESFAWPFGYYNSEGLEAARNAGFMYQVSVDYRIASRQDIPGIIPRYTVFGKDPVEQVRQILDGYRQQMQHPLGPVPPRK